MNWEMTSGLCGEKTLTVSWNDSEVSRLDLTAFDLALLRACDASPSFADKLLAMEMLMRKYEQANPLAALRA